MIKSNEINIVVVLCRDCKFLGKVNLPSWMEIENKECPGCDGEEVGEKRIDMIEELKKSLGIIEKKSEVNALEQAFLLHGISILVAS